MSKTVLITGSSSGIGKATAKYFQEKGWNVVATMRSPEKEEELNQLDNVLVNRLDVLDLDSIKNAIKEGVEKFGKIDVLVNNAGYGAFGPLEGTPRPNIKRQFDVNVIGLLDVTREMMAHFRANRDGVVVNISSVGGRIAMPLGSLYHGTKWAVEGISEGLSYEMEQWGGKIKIVEPGAIATDFAGRSFDFNNDESLQEYQDLVNKLMAAFGQMAPNGAPASMCAEVIYNAATDETGQMRFVAGQDAEQWLAARKELGDVAFINMLKQQFGLVEPANA